MKWQMGFGTKTDTISAGQRMDTDTEGYKEIHCRNDAYVYSDFNSQ